MCAVDQMLSASDISADSLAIKYSALGGRWICMFSASDISAVTSIVGRVQAELAPASAPEEAGDVIASFKKAFDAERKKKIEATVLAPGMNLEEFYRVGLEKLGGEIFSRTYNLLETVQLGVSFLVCGFSAGARPHLFVFLSDFLDLQHTLPPLRLLQIAPLPSAAWRNRRSGLVLCRDLLPPSGGVQHRDVSS